MNEQPNSQVVEMEAGELHLDAIVIETTGAADIYLISRSEPAEAKHACIRSFVD